jgi:hypothetical protein
MRRRYVFLVGLLSAQFTHAASIQPLGKFFASGVSADGNAVVGTASTSSGNRPALWRNGSLTILPGIADQEHLFAQNISPDGTTVVGEDYNVVGYRWRETTGYQSLPPLGIVWAASADGDVLVGQSVNGAFRWTENGGPPDITTIAGGGAAEAAKDVSLDGSIAVGSGGRSNGQIGVAFRWDEANGAVSLGEYPYGQAQGAVATNSSGSIVVGSTVLNGAEEAFRWTESDGLVGLGHLPTHVDDLVNTTAAVAVTDDGGLIIGNETVTVGATGEFAWTPSGGMQPLDAFLINEHGLDLGDWTLHYLVDMTPDGRFIIGNGSHPQFGDNVAFRILIPEPGSLTLALCSLLATRRSLRRRSVGSAVSSLTASRRNHLACHDAISSARWSSPSPASPL